MKRRPYYKANWGFTIIEVMIVLAVTSALLVSALSLVGGQQQKTEFRQSIEDIRQQIDGVINNVATGYYSSNSDFACSAGADGPNFTGSFVGKGKHLDCIFIGRALQFKANTDSKFKIYNLAGLRLDTSGNDVTDINQAKPKYIPGQVENKELAYGLQAKTITYNGKNSSGATISGTANIIAIVTDFAGVAASVGGEKSLKSSSRTAQLWSINDADISPTSDAMIYANNKYIGPVNNVAICFEGGNNQHATIFIGSNGKQLNTDLKIEGGACL